MIITAAQDKTHTPIGTDPVYYKSSCSVRIPAEEFGEGRHTFKGYMYPDIPDGKRLSDSLALEQTFEISGKSNRVKRRIG